MINTHKNRNFADQNPMGHLFIRSSLIVIAMKSILFAFLIALVILPFSVNAQHRLFDRDIELTFSLDGNDVRASDSIHILVQFRRTDGSQSYIPLLRESNVTSPKRFKVQAPGVLSVEIVSSNPTVIADKSEVEFFVLEPGRLGTILQFVTTIQADSNSLKRIPILLKRASAAKLCVPPDIESGSVQFTRRSADPRRVSVYTFSSRKQLVDRWFGGLRSGVFDIVYVDGEDSVKFRTSLSLADGDMKILECP